MKQRIQAGLDKIWKDIAVRRIRKVRAQNRAKGHGIVQNYGI